MASSTDTAGVCSVGRKSVKRDCRETGMYQVFFFYYNIMLLFDGLIFFFFFFFFFFLFSLFYFFFFFLRENSTKIQHQNIKQLESQQKYRIGMISKIKNPWTNGEFVGLLLPFSPMSAFLKNESIKLLVFDKCKNHNIVFISNCHDN